MINKILSEAMMAKNKVTKILNERLATVDAEIARAENNARTATDKARALKGLKLELTRAVKILQTNLR